MYVCTDQLFSQEWHVLYDSETDSPLAILSQLHNGRKQGGGELADTNHCTQTREGLYMSQAMQAFHT